MLSKKVSFMENLSNGLFSAGIGQIFFSLLTIALMKTWNFTFMLGLGIVKRILKCWYKIKEVPEHADTERDIWEHKTK